MLTLTVSYAAQGAEATWYGVNFTGLVMNCFAIEAQILYCHHLLHTTVAYLGQLHEKVPFLHAGDTYAF